MSVLIDRANSLQRRVPVWVIYVVLLLPVPWLLYLGLTNGLGREPIKVLEHRLGEIALQLLIAGFVSRPYAPISVSICCASGARWGSSPLPMWRCTSRCGWCWI